MNLYEQKALAELKEWQRKVSQKPSIIDKMTKGIQRKTNSLIPDKVHNIMTEAIKNMSKAVLWGSGFITGSPIIKGSLEEREKHVTDKLNFYKKTAALEGAGTGAGGFLLGLADFPLLLSIKMKFLFDIASLYGYDVRDYRERLYILYIFQLAFSSKQRQVEIYNQMLNWDNYVHSLPMDVDDFDWRTFQQEYRDYIDLAKMLQLVPGIGAAVGAYANYKLLDKLGETAVNAYRMRRFKLKV
ncbi:EcsC family protein [Clostridium sp. YIM B02515]|uniref:EcsC family protein n=1 Tax=Clostridium rhizosphaerae TaxID=2803861 RepID=A0ABS1TDC3_9CLOT|nr:EcsC family protein [Clostridium rhizosphaerae]MBL4937367.1 EcsC family protein [Clostridium rhizosphaerae]